MPTQKFALEKGGPQRLEITWKGSWKNGAIFYDGTQVGSFIDQKELKAGRQFPLPDGTILKIQVVQKFLYPELQIYRSGQPIPGSGADPHQRLAGAYGAIFFIAGMNLLLGFVAELGVRFLANIGFGVYSMLSGVIYLVLGFFVQRGSVVALAIAVGLFFLDGVFFLVDYAHKGGSPPVGGVLFRFFLLVLMIRGFEAIRALREPVGSRIATTPPSSPVVWPSSSQPVAPPPPSPGRVRSISFVAPPVPPSLGGGAQANPVEAERLRFEMSRTTQVTEDKGTGSRILGHPIRTDVRSKSAADSAAAAMRFVAYRCEISETGIRAIYSSGNQRDLPWGGITAIVLRQLPSGPPWEGKILVDLIPATSPGNPVTPLRLFSTTYVNYSYLPQGHSPSSSENLRRLANYVLMKNPSLQLEPGTALFLQAGKTLPRFQTLAQFAEYDSRYG